MRRVTVTVPDDLEQELEIYLAQQEAQPTITAVIQAALRDFLTNARLRERGLRTATQPFIPIILEEDEPGESDVSSQHDHFFSDAVL